MRARIMVAVTAVLLAIVAVLFIDPSAADEPESESRLSWSEQVTRVQTVMKGIDPDAILWLLTANVAFDGENMLGRNQQNVPFAFTLTSFGFDSSFAAKTYNLHMYDVELNVNYPLSATTYIRTITLTHDFPIRVSELQTKLPIGPFEICQSTLPTAQKLMHADLGHMYCGMILNQITSNDEFGLPAVWHVTWTNFEKRKVLQSVDLWIEPTTGKQLKIKADVRNEM